MTSARVTTLPTDTTKAANKAAAEKRETAAAYRKAAQFVGKQNVNHRNGLPFAHGPDSPQGQMAKALRDEATKLEEAAKIDEFTAKAVPISAMTADAKPSSVYGPDDKGRFWRIEKAELMPASAGIRLDSLNGMRFDLSSGRDPQYRLTLTQVKP